MNKTIKILFIRPFKASFIQKDLELLCRNFNVKVVDNFVLNKKKPIKSLETSIKMIAGILWADVTFSWFGGVPSYYAVKIAKIFGKKSISVFGGYEVAKIPEIAYGAMLYPNYANMTKYILQNSNKVLTVDEGIKN